MEFDFNSVWKCFCCCFESEIFYKEIFYEKKGTKEKNSFVEMGMIQSGNGETGRERERESVKG